MCPGHEPGMGTEQKPSWDKQGVVLSLTDMRQAPPIRCHSTQVRDTVCRFFSLLNPFSEFVMSDIFQLEKIFSTRPFVLFCLVAIFPFVVFIQPLNT